MKNILNWCYRNITARNPWALLIFSALLTLAALWVASGLRYNPRLDNLLPQELELVKDFNKVIEKTGNTGPLVVVLEGLDQKNSSEVIDSLSERFRNVPDVYFVDSRLPVEFLKNRQLLFATTQDLDKLDHLVEGAIESAQSSLTDMFGTSTGPDPSAQLEDLADQYRIFDRLEPYYNGKSGKRYYIFIQPRGTASNTGFTKTFVQSIQKQIDESGLLKQYPGLSIQFTGGMITRLEENRIVEGDLKNSVIVAVVLVTLLLAVYNKSFLSIILLFIPLTTSLSLTFAITRLLIGHVNIVSGFLVAILTGLGINYGIHLYIRFKQELRKGLTLHSAVELMATQVGRSGIIAMATTISVFSLLMFSDFKGFSEFGAIATIGILCAFISYFFILPALILCADDIHWLRKPRPRTFSLKISSIYEESPTFIATLFILLLISSLFLIPKIEFEHDFKKLRGESPAADFEAEATTDFGFAFSPTVIMTTNRDHLPEIHKVLQQIKDSHGEESTIGIHHSLSLFAREQYHEKKEIMDRIRDKLIKDRDIIEISMGTKRFGRLIQLLEAPPFDEKNIPDNILKRFTVMDHYLLLIFAPADKDFFDVRNIYQLENEINELKSTLAKSNIDIAVLNENLLAAAILSWVKQKGPLTLGFALIIVFIILLLDFGSLRLAFKTFLPLFTGLALTGALMALFHIKLNFINMVMLPSIVGIMIDHCVYLGHHILDYSRHETTRSVRETGSAIILSALASLAGYVSLNIAHHAGVRSIADVVEAGIIVCTLCALFMLPVLFQMGAHKSPSYQEYLKKKKHP